MLSSYTHVSDQHSTFGTKVFAPNAREAHYTLDEFLGNATDLPIHEHATDTHGVTLINFALFDLVGKILSPRIRDLGKITLVRDSSSGAICTHYPHAGPLLGHDGTRTWSPRAGPICCGWPAQSSSALPEVPTAAWVSQPPSLRAPNAAANSSRQTLSDRS